MKSHKYLRKEIVNNKTRYIYDETTQLSNKIVETMAEGSSLAGPIYRKAAEFFNRRRSKETGNEAGGEDQRRTKERLDFEAFAKSQGFWIDRLPEISSNNLLSSEGAEANVYLYGKSKVVKTVTMVMHEHRENPIEDFLERISMFNGLFPSSYLSIKGVGEFEKDGEKQFSFVLLQRRFQDFDRVPRDEARQFLKSVGFDYQNGNTYYNNDFIVDDLHADNIIKEGDEYFIIDAFVEHNNEIGWRKIEGDT